VKFTAVVLSLVLLLGPLTLAQGSRPLPAGMRHAQELEAQNEGGSQQTATRSADPVALQKEAEQLAQLAASVPPGVQNARRGLLEKDLIQKLKQIEKLSKHLRNQLNY
jgi:hypothetical protein